MSTKRQFTLLWRNQNSWPGWHVSDDIRKLNCATNKLPIFHQTSYWNIDMHLIVSHCNWSLFTYHRSQWTDNLELEINKCLTQQLDVKANTKYKDIFWPTITECQVQLWCKKPNEIISKCVENFQTIQSISIVTWYCLVLCYIVACFGTYETFMCSFLTTGL